jgi:hypothetical protein
MSSQKGGDGMDWFHRSQEQTEEPAQSNGAEKISQTPQAKTLSAR